MMRVVDRLVINASPDAVWPHAVDVEQWPTILPHYRWVRRSEGVPRGDGIVAMSARIRALASRCAGICFARRMLGLPEM